MFRKLLSLTLATTLFSACATAQQPPDKPMSLAQDKRLIEGLWAMRYLVEGETAVAEFRADGQLLLHAFNCVQSRRAPALTKTYSISSDAQFIEFPGPPKDRWKIMEFSPDAMKIAETGASTQWYDLVKTDSIDRACERYPELANERVRQTPYQRSDFIPAPSVPAHPDLQRYVGQWTSHKSVDLQIIQQPDGQVVLSSPSLGDWNALYNDVHWEGDQLHFQKFTYTDKPHMYVAPGHKALEASILRAMPDGTLRLSFVLNGDPYISILKRIGPPPAP